jgi:hypothetical protein
MTHPPSGPPSLHSTSLHGSWRTRAVLRLSGHKSDPAPERKSERAEARAVFRRFFRIITRAAAERAERARREP